MSADFTYYKLEGAGNAPLYFKATDRTDARTIAKILTGISIWNPLPKTYKITKVRR